jgi:hypothetical protein
MLNESVCLRRTHRRNLCTLTKKAELPIALLLKTQNEKNLLIDFAMQTRKYGELVCVPSPNTYAARDCVLFAFFNSEQ